MSSIGQATKEAVEEAATNVTTQEGDTEVDGPTEPPSELSADVIFEVLKNERRRRVIEYLREHDGPAELGAVAEHIAALENDKDEAAITYAERKRVYVGLYQCHLPKMDDMGVVEFNRARGRMELTAEAHHLDPYLEGPVSRRPWHRYYGGVVLAGLGTYAAMVAGALPTVLTPLSVFGAVLGAMVVCTACHAVDEASGAIPELPFLSR